MIEAFNCRKAVAVRLLPSPSLRDTSPKVRDFSRHSSSGELDLLQAKTEGLNF